MLIREISKVLGYYLYFLALALCIPFIIALYFQFIANPIEHPQPHTSLAFFITIVICLGIAVCFHWFGRNSSNVFFRREGLIVVVFIWFLTSVIGGLPFFLSKTLENPIDAYFETISGLTTTGSSVMLAKKYNSEGKEIPYEETSSGKPSKKFSYYGTIKPVVDKATGAVLYTGIEAVGKALLFWRSFIQWLGGMGIVVLFVAILPAFGVGGKVLFQTEMPGPTKDSVTPRIREAASYLWKIYLLLSVIELALLMMFNHNMPFFDALTITFSTLSTGGFSIKNDGIEAYHNASTEWIIIIFMIAGSVNFTLYFYAIKRKIYKLFDTELFAYITVLFIGSLIIIWNLFNNLALTLSADIRQGTFQFVSSISSTGFATVDYSLWPYLSQAVMLTSMFIGGMSGSTSGGIKIIRHYILGKFALHKMETIYRPDSVRRLRVANKEINNQLTTTVLCFFFIVMLLAVIATLLYIADGIDFTTAIGLTGCMMNNIGLAFGAALDSCAFMSNTSKILSSIWMVLGRLEYFAVLILLMPAFWRER